MRSSQILIFITAIAVTFSLTAAADDKNDHSTDTVTKSSGEVDVKALPMTEGEVKKIDKDTGKITIKHQPIANLGMPAMTMVFKVKEETMLGQVKVGDKIKFVAERGNGALIVTRIETAN